MNNKEVKMNQFCKMSKIKRDYILKKIQKGGLHIYRTADGFMGSIRPLDSTAAPAAGFPLFRSEAEARDHGSGGNSTLEIDCGGAPLFFAYR